MHVVRDVNSIEVSEADPGLQSLGDDQLIDHHVALAEAIAPACENLPPHHGVLKAAAKLSLDHTPRRVRVVYDPECASLACAQAQEPPRATVLVEGVGL